MTTQNNETTKNRPVHKIRDGALCVSIWRNERVHQDTGEVRVYFSMDHQRSYRKDTQWYHSSTVSGDECLRLANLYSCAHNWVLERRYQTNTQTQILAEQQEYAVAQDETHVEPLIEGEGQ